MPVADGLTPASITRALLAPGLSSSDFDLNPDLSLPPGRKLRPAAVLIPILGWTDTPSVVLTKRSAALKNHPGQIAFPGGKVDETDADPSAAALREASEEIGLPPSAVTLLGQLPDHETVTGFSVTPMVGWIHEPFDVIAEAGEVDEVFNVPLTDLLDQNRYQQQGRRWRGQLRSYYVVPHGPFYIWGATARMLRALAERLGG